MSTAARNDARIKSIEVSDEMITARLADCRIVSVPARVVMAARHCHFCPAVDGLRDALPRPGVAPATPRLVFDPPDLADALGRVEDLQRDAAPAASYSRITPGVPSSPSVTSTRLDIPKRYPVR